MANKQKSIDTDLNQQMGSYASKNGFLALGDKEVDDEVELTDSVRLDLGRGMAEAIENQKKLVAELSDYSKKLKAKIQECTSIVSESAKILERGSQFVQKTLPCFYDPIKCERVYKDFSSSLEIRGPANPDDAQQNLIDE